MNNQNREDYVDFNEQEYETEGFEDQGAFGESAYQDPGYDDAGLADDAGYEDEDFPEPGQQQPTEKKKLSPVMMAGAGALALTLVLGAGYYFTGGGEEGEGGFAMPDVMAMFTGESSQDGGEVPIDAPPEDEVPPEGEAAPPPKPRPDKPKPAAKPADDGWSDPVRVDKKPPAKPAAKPAAAKPAAAKPPAKPPAAKPKLPTMASKPKPPAPKPKPVAAKPKPKPAPVAAGGAGPSASTSVGFASGSYWVASADMEKLWAFSTGLKTNAGRITVESHPGSEANAADLSHKRAARVAELIKRNNVGNQFNVNVKIGKPISGPGRVNVYYSRQL